MNSNTATSTTRPSIAADRAYTQALSDLIAVEVAASKVEEFTPEFEVNPAYGAAERAVGAAWDALAAVVDAWAARR